MSEYIKTCIFCKKEIKMSNDSGRWNPYNKDGSAHDCRKKQETSTYTLDAVVKKLASIGVKIDLEAVMKQ